MRREEKKSKKKKEEDERFHVETQCMCDQPTPVD